MARIPYRQLAGMESGMEPGIPMPCHTTMFRRMRDLSVQTVGGMVTVSARDGSRRALYAVDVTGLKVDNRTSR